MLLNELRAIITGISRTEEDQYENSGLLLSLPVVHPGYSGSCSGATQCSPQLNTDKAAIQKWLARKGQTKWLGTEGDRIFLSNDDSDGFLLPLGDQEPSCVYMRTYRMKREARGSDVTRPAGYTTCVPVARFTMKRAAERDLEQRARSEY